MDQDLPKEYHTEDRCLNITWPCDVSDLLHLTQLRTESTVHTDNFIINDSCTRKTVEGIAERLPQLHAETTTTLIIESIYPVDTCALVVTSENEKIFRILDLIRKQKTDDFKRLFSSINVVSEKKIIGLQSDVGILVEKGKNSLKIIFGSKSNNLYVPPGEIHHTQTTVTNQCIGRVYPRRFLWGPPIPRA